MINKQLYKRINVNKRSVLKGIPFIIYGSKVRVGSKLMEKWDKVRLHHRLQLSLSIFGSFA